MGAKNPQHSSPRNGAPSAVTDYTKVTEKRRTKAEGPYPPSFYTAHILLAGHNLTHSHLKVLLSHPLRADIHLNYHRSFYLSMKPVVDMAAENC